MGYLYITDSSFLGQQCSPESHTILRSLFTTSTHLHINITSTTPHTPIHRQQHHPQLSTPQQHHHHHHPQTSTPSTPSYTSSTPLLPPTCATGSVLPMPTAATASCKRWPIPARSTGATSTALACTMPATTRAKSSTCHRRWRASAASAPSCFSTLTTTRMSNGSQPSGRTSNSSG